MDKRKLKFKSLHKNLISSQVSSTSDIYETRSLIEQLPKNNSTLLAGKVFSTQSENKSSNNDIFLHEIHKKKLNEKSRKRKSSNHDTSKYDSDNDIGFPLAESTILKKRRDDCSTIRNEYETNKHTNLSNVSIMLEKNINTNSTINCKFIEFLYESGIKLNSDAPHILCKDVIIVQKKMKELLNSKKYKKIELITLMEKYFENEQNFKNALIDMELFIDGEISNILYSSSLIKILLQVSELHPEIYNSLFSKLNEAVLIACYN